MNDSISDLGLILGLGAVRLGDDWRAGLPLEILVAGVHIPLLLLVLPP